MSDYTMEEMIAEAAVHASHDTAEQFRAWADDLDSERLFALAGWFAADGYAELAQRIGQHAHARYPAIPEQTRRNGKYRNSPQRPG